MQRALLGAAIALILLLVTALVGPLFVDWGGYRNAFEAEIARLTRLDVRISGPINVRLLPTPILTLQRIAIGRPDGPARVKAETLRIELALGPLMRGQLHPWDYEPRRDAAAEYFRNYGAPDPERPMRLPQPVPPLGKRPKRSPR